MSTEEAVANGVRWMNENLGHDWPEFIDRERLDLTRGDRCILGQTFASGYWGATGAFGISWSRENGFSTKEEYGPLQREWVRYLDGYDLLVSA